MRADSFSQTIVLPLILPDSSVTSPDHKVSVDLYSPAMFVLLPLFALLLKILYRHTYYLAHLVFAVHLFSAMFIAFALMLSIETLAEIDSEISGSAGDFPASFRRCD